MADTTDPKAPHGAQWPDASEWPGDDAPPIEVARFCRDRMGWIVFPCAGPADVRAYAQSLALKAAAEYALESTGSVEGEIPSEVSDDIWDDAREQADATLGRPIGYIYKAWSAKVDVASDVTDQMLREAWEPLESSHGPRRHADQRGVAILPNRSSQGFPVCLVDVDPRSGGEVDGPWGMQLAGPKASTPSGGVHTLVLSTGKETASADLGPGVDVVAGGGTTIPIPSGSATPGRRWLRHEQPVAAPDELRRRGRKRAAKAPQVEREPGDDWDEEGGHGATIVSSPVGDGERNRLAGVLVGVLARPRACPDDFVQAALELLAEDMAGRDVASPEAREESARWLHLLTRGPRDERFAAEFLECWLHVRDTSRKRMRTPAAKFVASVWRVCDRREGGRAGAEDFSVGAPVSAWPTTAWGPRPEPPRPPAEVVPPAPQSDHHPAQEIDTDPQPPQDVPCPAPPPEVAQAAVEASKAPQAVQATWRGGIDPRTYLRTLEQQYTDEDAESDEERSPIQIDKVFPAVDFVTGQWLSGVGNDKPALFHGWGEWLGRDLGGLAPRDFRVIGAMGAGAGKTWFEGWLAHGLAFATAARILGVKGFEEAPLVLPVWLTEMPKPGELYLRAVACHLGIPMDVVNEGKAAESSPRVVQFANRLGGGWTAEQVVKHGRAMRRVYGSDERFPFAFARRHVIRVLMTTDLPRVTRHHGVAYDHRGGVGIIDHVADAVDFARGQLAQLAGVSTDKILPLALIDPGQRFTSSTESSEKRAIDGLFEAIRQTLCLEIGAAVIATSDTTKAASRESSTIDAFLSTPTGRLGADIFAGSQAIQHQADCIALQAEPAVMGSGTRRTWVRTFKSRGGGSTDVAYPFTWEMGLGRFVAGEPEPLRPPPEQADRHRGGSERGGRGERERPAPRPFVPEGIRLPPLRGRHAEDLPD